MTDGTKAKAQAARDARLRAALRENLRRRKAQARGRTQEPAEPGDAEAGRARVDPDKEDR
jgi:hypothetical protein